MLAGGCRAVPSAFMFVGILNEELGSVHGLHNARFMLDQVNMGLHMYRATNHVWRFGLSSFGSQYHSKSGSLVSERHKVFRICISCTAFSSDRRCQGDADCCFTSA